MKYLRNCRHHTSSVPQSFLLLFAANLALAGCLGWNWSLWPLPAWLEVQWSKAVFFLILYDSINDIKHWWTVWIKPQPCHSHFCCWLLPISPLAVFWGWKRSLWPVPTWLAEQRSKTVFLLTLYDSINDMKLFQNFYITPQPCHSHFCCWLLTIWPNLDIWAENGSYGLCRLGWRYNGENLVFTWPYMIITMIWNTSKIFVFLLRRATAMFVVDCCQFDPSWILGPKMELLALPTWLAVQRTKSVFLLILYDNINYMNHFWTAWITPQLCHSHFCCWLLPIWP